MILLQAFDDGGDEVFQRRSSRLLEPDDEIGDALEDIDEGTASPIRLLRRIEAGEETGGDAPQGVVRTLLLAAGLITLPIHA